MKAGYLGIGNMGLPMALRLMDAGHTITVLEAGWSPGETVTIALHRDPLVHGDEVLTAVADESGRVTNTNWLRVQTPTNSSTFVQHASTLKVYAR